MAHFFFDLDECGVVTRDDEGREAADIAAAQWIAVQDARSIMADEVCAGHLCLGCHIDIRNEAGDIVSRVPFRGAIIVKGT